MNEITTGILHIGRKTISNIERGKGYINELKELGHEKFPIRCN